MNFTTFSKYNNLSQLKKNVLSGSILAGGSIIILLLSSNEVSELKDRLLKVKDPDTDEKIFEEIIAKENLYEGEYLNDAPDLILLPSNWNYMIYNDYEGQWFGSPESRFADHSMDGIFIWKGPNVRKGNRTNLKIYDLFPNILIENGMEIFSDLDGIYKKELFSKEKTNTIGYIGKNPRRDYLNNYEESVKKSLHDLGYI